MIASCLALFLNEFRFCPLMNLVPRSSPDFLLTIFVLCRLRFLLRFPPRRVTGLSAWVDDVAFPSARPAKQTRLSSFNSPCPRQPTMDFLQSEAEWSPSLSPSLDYSDLERASSLFFARLVKTL